MENLWLDSYSYDYEETYWEDKGGDNEDDDNISVMSFNDFARPKHLKIALVFLLDIKERSKAWRSSWWIIYHCLWKYFLSFHI